MTLLDLPSIGTIIVKNKLIGVAFNKYLQE